MCIIEAVSGVAPFYWLGEGFVLNDIAEAIRLLKLPSMQEELVLAMCCNDPRGRLQMSTVVNKLEQCAELEAITANKHTDPDPLVDWDTQA